VLAKLSIIRIKQASMSSSRRSVDGENDIAYKAPTQGQSNFSVYDPKKGPFTTENGSGRATINFAAKGVAALPKDGGSALMTFPEMLKIAAFTKGDRPALRVERPLPQLQADGSAKPSDHHELWKTWTFREYYEDACCVAKGLIKLGHQHHDAVAIFGFNRYVVSRWPTSSHIKSCLCQSINQRINQSINHSINQAIYQSTKPRINQ
jgi:hypothetical protein